MGAFDIREASPRDLSFLREMLYEAAAWPNTPTRDADESAPCAYWVERRSDESNRRSLLLLGRPQTASQEHPEPATATTIGLRR
jgi:hypothetical protein